MKQQGDAPLEHENAALRRAESQKVSKEITRF
jgi:hypothetical protein